MMRFEIIKKVYLWIIIGIVLVAGGIYTFFANMQLSIQFTGGMEIVIQSDSSNEQLKTDVTDVVQSVIPAEEDFTVSVGDREGFKDILLKVRVDDDERVNQLSTTLQNILIENQHIQSKDNILETSTIGPSVGDYMKQQAIKAIVIGLILMVIYILFAFSSMRTFINPAILGVITVATMIFDISVPAGAYGVLTMIDPTTQVDSIFIIAVLTVMGYSINDTIVIFDRIRENFKLNENKVQRGEKTYKEIFETSLWQTMRRSIGTSLSTFLVVAAMFMFGTGALKEFAFVLGVGVIAGTYSSIFLAAPMAYLVSGRAAKEKNNPSSK